MGVVRKRAIVGLLVLVSAIALSGCAITAPSSSPASSRRDTDPTPTDPTPTVETPSPTAARPAIPTPGAGFDVTRYSTDDPASIWIVSNKLLPLRPVDFVPADLVRSPVPHQNPPVLRRAASDALVALFSAAKVEGAGTLSLQSAYRSYAVQVRVYAGYVASDGIAQADAESARPGYSEHQTGLAVDISALPANCTLAACFGTTPQGRWLAANSWRFGYILRYLSDKTAITGYVYEPWHFRYVGVELATQMHINAVGTLEEFFRLPAAPSYVN